MGAIYYHVRPRYTAGSPAQLPKEFAEQVAEEERRAYAAALAGVWGLGEQHLAKVLGLSFIVESIFERAGGWDVRDELTGEFYRRLYRWKKGHRVDRWSDECGWVRGVVVANTESTSVLVRDADKEIWTSGSLICRDDLRSADSVKMASAT